MDLISPPNAEAQSFTLEPGEQKYENINLTEAQHIWLGKIIDKCFLHFKILYNYNYVYLTILKIKIS